MGKISNYTRVLVSKLTDVFACDQTDNGTTETKSATVEQIGTAIGTLQNFADLDTSNKNLVDAINEIASYTPVYGNTASGVIATFDTSLALPLQDLQIAINAVQESGTPTPSSPKAISGFTGANIHVADNETPHIIDNVTAISWQSEAGIVYGGSLKIAEGFAYGKNNNGYLLLDGTENWNELNNQKGAYLILNDAKIVNSYGQAISSQYELSNWTDVSTGTNNMFTVYKASGWTDARIVFNYNGGTLASFKAQLTNSPVQVVYELTTPVEYILTGIPPIYTLNGTNNIFTDTNGNTSVVYACSLKDYIDRQ